jgi:hypothetical protein
MEAQVDWMTEAIVANNDGMMRELWGLKLAKYLDVLEVPDECRAESSDETSRTWAKSISLAVAESAGKYHRACTLRDEQGLW